MKRLFGVFFAVMFTFSVSIAFAGINQEEYVKEVYISYNNQVFGDDSYIPVYPSSKLVIGVNGKIENEPYVWYFFRDGNIDTEVVKENSSRVVVLLPDLEYGKQITMYVAASPKNVESDAIWHEFKLIFIPNQINLKLIYDLKSWQQEDKIEVSSNDEIFVVANTTNKENCVIGYYFEDKDGKKTDIIDIKSDVIKIIVPKREPGTVMLLAVEALSYDSKSGTLQSGWHNYLLEWQ